MCIGIWANQKQLESLREIERIFEPNKGNSVGIIEKMNAWERAVIRFKEWHQ